MKIKILIFILLAALGGMALSAGCGGGGDDSIIPDVNPAPDDGGGGGGGGGQASVSTSSPQNGQANVASGQAIAFTFSEAITEPSDWSVVFILQQGGAGSNLCTGYIYDPITLTVTCLHGPLLAGITYTETLSGLPGVTDTQITFTVADASVQISPFDGSLNVDPSAIISVVFSDAIQEPLDWASTFLLQLGGAGPSLCISVIYDPASLTAICAHNPLLSAAGYSASLLAFTGVSATTSSFVIGNGIVLLSPGDGSVNVDPAASVSATYSQPIVEPADWSAAVILKRDNAGASLCTSVVYDAINSAAMCAHEALVSGGSYTLSSLGVQGMPDSQSTFIVINSSASFSPSDGSAGNSPSAAVTATFSGIIDEPADWMAVFTLKRNAAGASLCTSVTYDSINRVATCVHDAMIAGGSYAAAVSGLAGVTDGQSSFLVQNAAATLSPPDLATDINPATPVTALFSGPIDEPVDWLSAFTLKKNGTGPSVCSSVIYDGGTLTATCAHNPLEADIPYTSAISGIAGVDAVQAIFTVSFANVTILPADGSVNVEPLAAVTATFSSPISEPADWMAALTLKLDGAGASLCTSVSYDAPSLTATCIHNAMTSGRSYMAAISGITGIADSQASFVIKDATVSFSPTNGSVNVNPNAPVTAVFSAPIDEPVNWLTVFTLKKNGAGSNLCTSVSYIPATLTATCNHADLQAGRNYTAAISGLAGVTNGQASFTIKNATVTFVPANGATNVSVTTVVTATFSGPIEEPGNWNAAFTLRRDGVGMNRCTSVTYNAAARTATCAHSSLQHNRSYTSFIISVPGVTNTSATFATVP